MKLSKQMNSIIGLILFGIGIAMVVFFGTEGTTGFGWMFFWGSTWYLYSGGLIKKRMHLLAIGAVLLLAGSLIFLLNSNAPHRFIDLIFGGISITIDGIWFRRFKKMINQQNSGDERTHKFLVHGAYYTWLVMIVLWFASVFLDMSGIINIGTISPIAMFLGLILLLFILPFVFVLYFERRGDVW
ncbi:MAG: hypothetical protein O8C66_13280 [Candidatus Methanoperedens sp.]|nr:hypothetical protein [Candidatus Methanoperedens sp.]MCZ7371470.1 hypothetical protein [Candidatus Methanoperedens sp.]